MQEATKTDVHGRESRVELVYIKGTQVNFLILPGACGPQINGCLVVVLWGIGRLLCMNLFSYRSTPFPPSHFPSHQTC